MYFSLAFISGLILCCTMKHIKTGTKRGKFAVLASTRSAQAAMMTLQPGDTSDSETSNEHPDAEQWLFVISGTGTARVGKRKGAIRQIAVKENSLVLIEKRELHQIRNTGRQPLVTINFYIPPAYAADGELKNQ
jgi:mannose-6-phosphate isomerase-like protein (cupin superfamily)